MPVTPQWAAGWRMEPPVSEPMAYHTSPTATAAAAPPEEEVDFVLNRPFVFAITGTDGLPLFVGIIHQPQP